MPRLIDADALSKLVGEPIEVFLRRLDLKLPPTVDAVPVRHGKWLDADDGIGCTCSICGYDAWADTPFCPNCGAKMIDERHLNGTTGESKSCTVINTGNATSTVRNLYYEQLQEQSDGNWVEVVRCKDCKHYFADPWGYGNCVFEGGVSRRTKTSDYCSWGERRKDETD